MFENRFYCYRPKVCPKTWAVFVEVDCILKIIAIFGPLSYSTFYQHILELFLDIFYTPLEDQECRPEDLRPSCFGIRHRNRPYKNVMIFCHY